MSGWSKLLNCFTKQASGLQLYKVCFTNFSQAKLRGAGELSTVVINSGSGDLHKLVDNPDPPLISSDLEQTV